MFVMTRCALNIGLAVSITLLSNTVTAAPPIASCNEEIGETISVGQGIPAPATYVQARSTSNFFLKHGQCLVSPNRAFAAVMQADGEFVVYRTANPVAGKHIWAASTVGNPGAGLLVKQDGNIAIYTADGIDIDINGIPSGDEEKVKFQSNPGTRPFSDYYLAMQDDGNVVLYKGTPQAHQGCIWSVYTGSPCNKSPQPVQQCKWVCTYDPSVGQQCQTICRR